MTIASAESLVACGGFDGPDMARRIADAHARPGTSLHGGCSTTSARSCPPRSSRANSTPSPAFLGASAIPDPWRERVEATDHIAALAGI